MRKKESKFKFDGIVVAPSRLLDFLIASQPDKSRNKVKSQLSHRQVSVNKVVVTQFDTMLQPGDRVTVSASRSPEAFRHPMIRIVYEDDYIIVADKRNGLLTVGTDKERTRTAFYLMSEHVKQADPANRIFIVHRLDRETSGLLVFAKSEEIQSRMQRNWKQTVVSRKYIAIAEGELPATEGVINESLAENKNFKVYVDPEGEKAVTEYRVLASRNGFSMVELSLQTGRKNQIRAHLEHIGNPIAGDKKYNAVTNPAGRVCLHAMVLDFIHPVTGEQMNFSTAVPKIFQEVLDGEKTSIANHNRRNRPGRTNQNRMRKPSK